VQVWQTSNLRRLTLGEEKRKKEETTGQKDNVRICYAGPGIKKTIFPHLLDPKHIATHRWSANSNFTLIGSKFHRWGIKRKKSTPEPTPAVFTRKL